MTEIVRRLFEQDLTKLEPLFCWEIPFKELLRDPQIGNGVCAALAQEAYRAFLAARLDAGEPALLEDEAMLSLAVGISATRDGYRVELLPAPTQEDLAAAPEEKDGGP